MYDVVLFIDMPSYYTTDLITVQNPYIGIFRRIIDSDYTYGGYVFMNLMPTSWTQLTTQDNLKLYAGPYIEYGVAPTTDVRVRRNGLSIERYCTGYDGNIDYQLLARSHTTYYVYGLMLEEHMSFLF